METVYFKLALSLILIGASYLLFCIRERFPTIFTPSNLGLAWVGLRIVPFLLVFMYLGMEPRSDVFVFREALGVPALGGGLVYRDFVCTYAPFFPYLLSFALSIWDDTRSLILLMIVFEALTLVATYAFYKPKIASRALVFNLLLYLLLPSSLILCVLGGQEDVWTWLFVALAGWGFYRKKNYILYGSLLTLGLLTTKATFVLVIPALLILARDRFRLVATLAVWGVAVLGLLYALVGMEFTQPINEAGTLRAPNLLSILNPWVFDSIGVGQSFWNWAGLIMTVGISCLVAWRLRTADFQQAVSRVYVVTYATMMVVQQSAYSNYIFLFLIPLIFCVIDWQDQRQVALFMLFNLLCAVHPSYWWGNGLPKYLAPSDIWASGTLAIDYAMQVGIVGLAVYFVWLAARVPLKARLNVELFDTNRNLISIDCIKPAVAR